MRFAAATLHGAERVWSILARTADLLPRRDELTRYSPRPIVTVRSPPVSVRRVRTRAAPSISRVPGLGCPKSLPSPTLMRATAGAQDSRASAVSPFVLPWWGTLSTSTCDSTPASAIPRCAASSASPVRIMPNEPREMWSTTLVSLVSRSPEYSCGGHSTRTTVCPMRQLSPETSGLTTASGPRHSGVPGMGSARRRVVSDGLSSGSNAPGTPIQPTSAMPASPDAPPVWSA